MCTGEGYSLSHEKLSTCLLCQHRNTQSLCSVGYARRGSRTGTNFPTACDLVVRASQYLNLELDFVRHVLSMKPFGVESFQNQSPGNPILNIGRVGRRGDVTKHKIFAKFADVRTRSMDGDDLQQMGNLDAEGTKTVVYGEAITTFL